MSNNDYKFYNLINVNIVDDFKNKPIVQVNIDSFDYTNSIDDNIVNNYVENISEDVLLENNIINDISDDIENINLEDNYECHYITFTIISDFYNSEFDNNSLINKGMYIYDTVLFHILVEYNDKLPTFPLLEIDSNFKYKKFIRDKMINEFKFKSSDIKFIKLINNNGLFHNYLIWVSSLSSYNNTMNMTEISKDYGWRTFISFVNLELSKNIPIHKQICDSIQNGFLNPIHIELRHNLGKGVLVNNIKINDVLEAYKNINL